jgi:hypothetical protein
MARQTEGRRKSEAELVAESHARCDQCGDDANPLIHVAIDQIDLRGRSIIGHNICAHCLPLAGFTGWSHAAGGWADPLGHDKPLPEEGDQPAGWLTIAAALEGRLLDAA